VNRLAVAPTNSGVREEGITLAGVAVQVHAPGSSAGRTQKPEAAGVRQGKGGEQNRQGADEDPTGTEHGPTSLSLWGPSPHAAASRRAFRSSPNISAGRQPDGTASHGCLLAKAIAVPPTAFVDENAADWILRSSRFNRLRQKNRNGEAPAGMEQNCFTGSFLQT
jgi:hypothetical protein